MLPDAAPQNGGRVQLRQMAVYEKWQGKGIGRQLVQAAEKLAIEKGYKKWCCTHAM